MGASKGMHLIDNRGVKKVGSFNKVLKLIRLEILAMSLPSFSIAASEFKLLRKPPTSVKQYHPIEYRFDLQPLPSNPWDPAAIGVIAEVRSPSKKVINVLPFYTQDYNLQTRTRAEAMSPVVLFRIFVSPLNWPDAKKLTLFIDDVRLVEKETGEVFMLGDFEDGEQAWSPGKVSSEKAYKGKHSLKVEIDLFQSWPGANLRPPITDWSRFKELRFAVFPETDGTKGTLSVEFWQDIEKDIKTQTSFSTANRMLKLNEWSELVWDFSKIPARREVTPIGKPHFCFRIALLETGKHRIRLLSGNKVVHEQVVECIPAPWPKPVRVSTINRRYFETIDGVPLFLIGENSTFPYGPDHISEYELIFPKLREAGCNYVRFWVGPGQCLEFEKLGEYPLERCFLYDKAIEIAMQNGLYCLFCIQFFGDLNPKTKEEFWPHNVWEKNAYNAILGGPCEKPMDFMTNPKAKEFYQQRLRYIVARWGAYQNILAWQFWNEVDLIRQYDSEIVTRWHEEMGDYLRSIDPYKHLITTSCAGSLSDPKLWAIPQMDFIQTHTYRPIDKAHEVYDLIAYWSKYDKPYFPGEFGINWRDGHLTAQSDPTGLHLHNGFWAALASGGAGIPMTWWWDSYVDELNLYHHFIPIARFVKGIPFSKKQWHKAKISQIKYVNEKREIYFHDIKIFPQAGFEKAKENIFVINRDEVRELKLLYLSRFLHATGGHADKRNPPVFEVDYLKPGRFTVKVNTVSQMARLEIWLNDNLVLSKELPAGEGLGKESKWDEKWKIWYTTYDTEFSIDVPAGKHRIKVDNTGRDWIQVDHYAFENYGTDEKPPLRILGLTADDIAILWVQNRENTWLNHHKGIPVKPVEPSSFVLEGMKDGRYRIEFWDTFKGIITNVKNVSARNGKIRLEVPLIDADIALKLIRKRQRSW